MVCILAAFSFVYAEDADHSYDYARKQVLILKSTTNYKEAHTTASEAAKELHVKEDLEGLRPNAESGLSLSQKGCDAAAFDYPCYVARGRNDDGIFISIEWSDAYLGFHKGYYLVVLATEPISEKKLLKDTLVKARSIYPDAYLKTTQIYMACMH